MFELRDQDGKMMGEYSQEHEALARLRSWPSAWYVEEVYEVRKLVSIKGDRHEACQQVEDCSPPW